MPIYEYRCNECRRRSSVLLLSYKEQVEPICPYCGGRELTKLISRFAVVRSEESRLESLADGANLAGVDESDPRAMARAMKKLGQEFGDELGDDFEAGMEEAMQTSGAETTEES